MLREKRGFIIKNGILGWGVPLWLTMSLWNGFQKLGGGIFEFSSFNLKRFLLNLLIGFPVSLVGGYCYGLWMYGFWEKYKKPPVQ